MVKTIFISASASDHNRNGGRIGKANVLCIFFQVCLLVLQNSPLPAQADIGASSAIKIGFLLSPSDLDPIRPLMEKLRESLMANPKIADAMKLSGFEDIWLRPCDDPFDMIQRLRAEEFDLVFATSVIYARQFQPREDEPALFRPVVYEPIFQFRHPDGDILDPKGHGVFRKAVLFVGPASSLWGKTPAPDQIRAELERERIAVSDSYSATSYIYPQLKIRDDFVGIAPRGPAFCKTESEVVKHVVTGLLAIGACDARTLSSVLGEKAAPGGYVMEILRTDRIPADPILLRRDWLPQGPNSPLGTELKVAIHSFFNATPAAVAGLKVEKAERRAFEEMARALVRLDADKNAARGIGEQVR